MTEPKIVTPLSQGYAEALAEQLWLRDGVLTYDNIGQLLLAVDAASRKQAQADRDMERCK